MMEWTAVVSIICLGIVGVLCLAGVFCDAFDESWLQFVGLWCIGGVCFSRLEVIATRGHVSAEIMILHLGLACYALGVAIKVAKFSRPDDCRPRDILEVKRHWWQHIGGGTKE